jgi:hypothetical protein
MKQTVTEYDFVNAFDQYNRSENFSRQGRHALFEWLSELEEDMGEEIELDVIGICCAFTEYESIGEFNEAYGTEYEDWDEVSNDRGNVIPFTHADYFAEGHSVTNPLTTERAIVEDY